jgi:hypothetical protein
MLFPVAWPKRPPNVIIGDRQAKYRKIQEAMHCRASASLKSGQYLNNEHVDISLVTISNIHDEQTRNNEYV